MEHNPCSTCNDKLQAKNFPYISYGAYSFVAHVLTNYRQLLLYICMTVSNLYTVITSKCFLVPITTTL